MYETCNVKNSTRYWLDVQGCGVHQSVSGILQPTLASVNAMIFSVACSGVYAVSYCALLFRALM